MIFFPAIDLIAGNVVRLRQGKRSQMDVYSTDPLAIAESFAEAGATWVHVVDLSSALGEDASARAANDAAIKKLARANILKIDVGGGVRTLGRIQELHELEASRVAIGTPLVKDPAMAEAAARNFGEFLVADIAAKEGQVRVNGWQDKTPLALDELVSQVRAWGFKHLVYTDIARDGTGSGINAAAYQQVAAVFGHPVVASGGIASIADVQALAALGSDVIEGAIAGRALYTGALDLTEALAAMNQGGSHAV